MKIDKQKLDFLQNIHSYNPSNSDGLTVTFHPSKGLLLFTNDGKFIGSTLEIKLIDNNDEGYWKAQITLLVKVENLEVQE